MTLLIKLYYSIFKHYNILETKFVSYTVGDQMIRESEGKLANQKWVLAPEEDGNLAFGMVYLCRKERKLI